MQVKNNTIMLPLYFILGSLFLVNDTFVQPTVPNPKIFNLQLFKKDEQQILKFEKLESANVWQFCLKNDLTDWLIWLITNISSMSIYFFCQTPYQLVRLSFANCAAILARSVGKRDFLISRDKVKVKINFKSSIRSRHREKFPHSIVTFFEDFDICCLFQGDLDALRPSQGWEWEAVRRLRRIRRGGNLLPPSECLSHC